MSINEKALANVTILKYNNAQSLNDFKAGHVDVLDIIVNLIFHLQNRHYFPLCAVVVRLLFATALQSNRIINLRMSRDHQKLNSILLST